MVIPYVGPIARRCDREVTSIVRSDLGTPSASPGSTRFGFPALRAYCARRIVIFSLVTSSYRRGAFTGARIRRPSEQPPFRGAGQGRVFKGPGEDPRGPEDPLSLSSGSFEVDAWLVPGVQIWPDPLSMRNH